MLPKHVICPRCRKPGFLTLRWVRSSIYCKNEPPNSISHWIDMPLLNTSIAGNNGQTKPTTTTRRMKNLHRYAPNWYLYIGHFDLDKYRRAMERYKRGRLKSRPNGRIWHKVRYKRAIGHTQSDLEVLMAKYNFSQLDINEERRKKEEDMRLMRGIF